MRHVLPLLLLILVGLFAAYVHSLIAEGDARREAERAACRRVEEIVRAQQRWSRRPDRAEGEVPYTALSALIEAGALDGFEPAGLDEDGAASEVYRSGDYHFELALKPGASGDGVPQLGGRFVLWAWPAIEGRQRSLLFWASNAGYLLQGENGSVAGAGRPPYGDNPLREVSEDEVERATGGRPTGRWRVLQDLGASEVADAEAQ